MLLAINKDEREPNLVLKAEKAFGGGPPDPIMLRDESMAFMQGEGTINGHEFVRVILRVKDNDREQDALDFFDDLVLSICIDHDNAYTLSQAGFQPSPFERIYEVGPVLLGGGQNVWLNLRSQKRHDFADNPLVVEAEIPLWTLKSKGGTYAFNNEGESRSFIDPSVERASKADADAIKAHEKEQQKENEKRMRALGRVHFLPLRSHTMLRRIYLQHWSREKVGPGPTSFFRKLDTTKRASSLAIPFEGEDFKPGVLSGFLRTEVCNFFVRVNPSASREIAAAFFQAMRFIARSPVNDKDDCERLWIPSEERRILDPWTREFRLKFPHEGRLVVLPKRPFDFVAEPKVLPVESRRDYVRPPEVEVIVTLGCMRDMVIT